MVDEKLIQIGERGRKNNTLNFYINKTHRFLLPTLKSLGEEFTATMRKFRYLGTFVEDLKEGSLHDNCLTLVFYPNDHMTTDFLSDTSELLEFSKQQYSRNNLLFNVVEVPDHFKTSYVRFLEGRYSEMYKKKDLDKYFPIEKQTLRHKHNKVVRKVVQKDITWRNAFENLLNEQMSSGEGTKIELTDENELEFLPRPYEEIIFPG